MHKLLLLLLAFIFIILSLSAKENEKNITINNTTNFIDGGVFLQALFPEVLQVFLYKNKFLFSEILLWF